MAKGNIAGGGGLKKNLTNSARPSGGVGNPGRVSANNNSNSTSTAGQVAKFISGDANFVNISQSWDKIAAIVAGQLGPSGGVFTKGKPIAFDRGILTLEFPAEVKAAVDIFGTPAKQKVLASAVGSAVGSSVTLKLTVAQGGEIAKPKGARISNEDKNKVLENQAVQTVLEGLGATVTGIELGQ